MKVSEIEKLSGKRLTLKEKISFRIVQSMLRKEIRKADKNKDAQRSKIALVLSILSLLSLLLFPLSVVLAVTSIILASKALKVNLEDRKARTAMSLSPLAPGIILVGLLIKAIFVSDGALRIFTFS